MTECQPNSSFGSVTECIYDRTGHYIFVLRKSQLSLSDEKVNKSLKQILQPRQMQYPAKVDI